MKKEIITNKFSKEVIEAKVQELTGMCSGLTSRQIEMWAIQELGAIESSRWTLPHAVSPIIGKGAKYLEDNISFTRAIEFAEE